MKILVVEDEPTLNKIIAKTAENRSLFGGLRF